MTPSTSFTSAQYRLVAWLRPLLAYAIAVGGIAVASALIGLVAYLLRLDRIETYPLVYLLFVALVTVRFGQGPALVATAAAAVAMDSVMIPPARPLDGTRRTT